jgi:hypothetical protein
VAAAREALDLVPETVEALLKERGEQEKVRGSLLKQTLKRRKPGCDETCHGFRTFGQLLEEAQAHNMLSLQLDEKSGRYIIEGLAREDQDSGPRCRGPALTAAIITRRFPYHTRFS